MVRRMGQSGTAHLIVARRLRDNACGVCKTHSPKTVRGHRGPACATWCGCHYDEQACGGEMGEKEKWSGLCTMKRGGSGDLKTTRNGPM